MSSANRFTLFGPDHLAVLFLTLALPVLLAFLVRTRGGERRVQPICYSLAVILVLNQVILMIYVVRTGLPVKEHLPFQLCDWAMLACVAALLWRHRLAYELSYFWGLAGTLQAVLTPDLEYGFPNLGFILFSIAHSGIIVAILFLTLGLRMRPTFRSLWRAFFGVQVYAVVTVLLNLALGTNYGYLMHKPARPSLLDFLGPWPWYIVSLEIVGLALFFLFYAPFAVGDRLQRESFPG